MIYDKKVTAIILSAGNSTRYNKNINKNFEIIGEKPVLSYSLKSFDENKYVDNIIVAIKENEINKVKEIISKGHLSKLVNIVIGRKFSKSISK